ncbi:MAG: GTPase, partial [Pirellulaceae bacterium]
DKEIQMQQELNTASVVTRLTPQGRGAVAVISVAGVNAVEQVDQHFVSAAGKPLASFPLDRIIFGRWEQRDGSGEEIVVCRTGECSLEVNCHGGVAAARAIINALVADGGIEQSASTWATGRSDDCIQAEAWLALADARTERAAAILLDQYRGALRQAIEAVIQQLESNELVAATQRLTTLLERGEIGLHLTTPWRVVLVGPPNVGKSSLVNCLLGYQRSIVFDQPGTTRDLLSAPTAFEGWSMELTDTAGLRDGGDAIEVEGVSRATSFLTKADLTVLVFDATCEWEPEHERLVAENPKSVLVFNKCDLRAAPRSDARFLATSALTGRGAGELMQMIVKRLVRLELMPGDAVPFTPGQVETIASARRAVNNECIPVAITTLKAEVSRKSAATR